jgi:hypothetical protein
MWIKSYSKKYTGLKAEEIWAVWTNVNEWNKWQLDTEQASMVGEFKVGNTFMLKPKGGPRVNIEIIQVVPFKQFTDLTRFPGARMYGDHEFISHENGELEIKTTMSIEGPLSFIWRKIVAEGVANGLPEQTEWLISRVKNG